MIFGEHGEREVGGFSSLWGACSRWRGRRDFFPLKEIEGEEWPSWAWYFIDGLVCRLGHHMDMDILISDLYVIWL